MVRYDAAGVCKAIGYNYNCVYGLRPQKRDLNTSRRSPSRVPFTVVLLGWSPPSAPAQCSSQITPTKAPGSTRLCSLFGRGLIIRDPMTVQSMKTTEASRGADPTTCSRDRRSMAPSTTSFRRWEKSSIGGRNAPITPLTRNEPFGPEPEYEGIEIRNSSMPKVFSKNSEGKGRHRVDWILGKRDPSISHSRCTPGWTCRVSSTGLGG